MANYSDLTSVAVDNVSIERSAIGELKIKPYNINFILFPAEFYANTYATPQVNISTAAYHGNYWYITNNLNDIVSFRVYSAVQATKTLNIHGFKNTGNGIITIKVNGTTVGTAWDQYNGSGAYEMKTVAAIALTAGINTISFEIASKNASAIGYKFSLSAIEITP
jgi:hypothetical protein